MYPCISVGMMWAKVIPATFVHDLLRVIKFGDCSN